jgi:hypothetical protein
MLAAGPWIEKMAARLIVKCYAGYKADERPIRFTFASRSVHGSSGLTGSSSHADPTDPAAKSHEVSEVLDRWYGPGYECFKVRADDDNLYILRHQLGEDTWELDAFRAECNAPGR